jgi:hypothetical protein
VLFLVQLSSHFVLFFLQAMMKLLPKKKQVLSDSLFLFTFSWFFFFFFFHFSQQPQDIVFKKNRFLEEYGVEEEWELPPNKPSAKQTTFVLISSL